MLGTRGHFDWQDVLDLVVGHPRPRAVPGRQAVGLLRQRAADAGGTRARLVRVYRGSRAAHQAGRRRDPRAPRALPRTSTRPTWSSRRSCYVAGALRTAGAGHRPRLPGPGCSRAWASTRSTRRRSPAGTGARPGCRRTRCTCASTCANYLLDTPRAAREGRLDAGDALAARSRSRAPGAPSATRGSRRAPTPSSLRMARPAAHRANSTRPGARTSSSAPTCASGCCATCCSPAPTPTCTDARATRACDDFHRTSEAVAATCSARPAHPPPGARPAASAPGSRSTRRRRCRSPACSRPPRPTPRPRRTRRCSSRSSCPAAATCSTRSSPLHDYGRYADLRNDAQGRGAAALGCTGLGLHPSLSRGVGGGVKGLFERGKIGFLPGIDYAEPRPLALPLAPLLGDRPDHRPRGAGLARPLARPRRRPRQPAAGHLDGLRRSRRSCAPARAPVAAVASPGDAGFWIRGVWGEPTTRR